MDLIVAAWGAPALEFPVTAATNWWSAEEAAADDAQVWAPAGGGLPALEYASIDMFGTSSCSLQPYYYVVPASISSSSGGAGQHQQLAEYSCYNNYVAAAPTETATTTQAEELSLQVDYYSQDTNTRETVEDYINRPSKLFQKRDDEFWKDAELVRRKMHRYPPSIRDVGGGLYTKPRVVAIGPYHHYGGDHLHKAEKVKHVAAHHCIGEYKKVVNNNIHPDLLVQQLYGAVVSAVNKKISVVKGFVVDARGLYDKDAMAGISDDAFLPMMFYDACFLVMYMLRMSGVECDTYLLEFFVSNNKDIAHDIMLLENQIPWLVVDAIMDKCTPDPLETKKKFIARWKEDGFLQDQADHKSPPVEWDEEYEPPHLLGLLRFYNVGKTTKKRTGRINKVSDSDREKMDSITLSAGAVELAYMGIFVAANETREITDMGLARKYIFLAELSMAPLCLDDLRASWLVNMAALELCTTQDFFNEEDPKVKREDSAVCSYLRLLCMLAHREEDVHELRTNDILQGAGLTNKQALDFFSSLHILPKGRHYAHVMVRIQNYRNRRPLLLELHKFVYKNWKYISGLLAFLGTVIPIIIKLQQLTKGAAPAH